MASRSSPSPRYSYPEWQPQYEAAIMETNPEKLSVRTQAARDAMETRLKALSQSSDGESEREAIQNGFSALEALGRAG